MKHFSDLNHDSYISSEERTETQFCKPCYAFHTKEKNCPMKKTDSTLIMFNTEEEALASKIPDLIFKIDKTSYLVDDRSWGDGNPCYAVYYIPNKNIHVKLEGILDEHSSPKQQWYRSFICKEIVKEYTEYEEVKMEKSKPSEFISNKTKQQIIDMVNICYQSDLDLLGDEYDYGKAFTVNHSNPNPGFISLVEEGKEPAGGEGEYNVFRLYHIPSYDFYIKVLGYYNSYQNTSWNSMCFVKKVTKQKTVYV